MKPILPSFLPSFLALIAASLGPAEALAAQQQIWVDAGNRNGPWSGTQMDPYGSLSDAILNANLQPGDVIKILGNNTFLYTNDAAQPAQLKEAFPIFLPDGVTLEFVPSGINPVRRATFKPTGSGAGLTCFQINSGTSATPTKIMGHFDTNPMTVPDLNQGIVVQDFEEGFLVADNGVFSSVFNLDGILFDGCRTGFRVNEKIGSDSVMGTLQRSRILGSSGTFVPDKPLVDLQVNASQANMDITLQQDVVLPQGQNLDKGIDNTVPSDSLDFRGAARLFDDPNIPNAPMQAGKDIGAFEKQVND